MIIGPSMAMGNTCVLVPSAAYPLAATDLAQVLDTSDVPAGVINVVTGAPSELAPVLASHADVDTVWSFAGGALSPPIESGASATLKRTWVAPGLDFSTEAGEGRAFLNAATECRTVWIPYGEG